MNPKTAFRNTLKLMNSERPVFVPLIYGLAAKISQFPLEEMVADASYYAHSLEEASELLRCDGIVNSYDATIEAEAFGCDIAWPGDYAPPEVRSNRNLEMREINPETSHRISVLMETTKRIAMTRGKDAAIIGTLTGPVSLVKTLTDGKSGGIETAIPLAGNLLMKLVKNLGELRVDAVFFREDIAGAGFPERLTAHEKPFTAVYNTLFNLVRHYNGFPVIITEDLELDTIPELHRMIAPGGIILLGKGVNEGNLARLLELSASLKLSFGLPLPLADAGELDKQFNVINKFINQHKPSGFFYVTDGEIPYDTPLEMLHDLTAKIQSR